jgi:UDP-N-acetylmuramate--alanine ligase
MTPSGPIANYTPPAGSIPTLHVPTLQGVRAVHLIGIGGAGMLNLARLLHARAVTVTGSDLKDTKGTAELRAQGIDVRVGHAPDHLGEVDVVIVSSAIGEGHGKTTTTSMVAVILEHAGLDPSFLIGGDLNESGSGARHGKGNLFVFEADESDGSFLLSSPDVGIVTNIEIDHVDFYPGGIDEIVAAFAAFASRCSRVVAWGDDPRIRRALGAAGVEAVTYGGAGNDVIVSVDRLGPEGAKGSVKVRNGVEVPVALRIDGPHSLLNAAAAIAACQLEGVDPTVAADALSKFAGVHRRFELRGSARGAWFYDDYGQLPTEMEVTLATARRRRPNRLIAVVQPHRYSRVQSLWRELGASVVGADVVVVTDVYGAAQEPIPGVTGKLVVDGVQLAAPGIRTVYLPHRTDVVAFLDREVREGDLVVTMGCGDVWMLGDAALEQIRENDGVH